jgi:hypothetical protein
MRTWRKDVNPDRLVTRHLRVAAPANEVLRDALARLQALEGVQDVTWHPDDGSLNLIYDAGVEDLATVRAAAEAAGLHLVSDWHERLSETLWRFEDSLMRASVEPGERHTPG